MYNNVENNNVALIELSLSLSAMGSASLYKTSMWIAERLMKSNSKMRSKQHPGINLYTPSKALAVIPSRDVLLSEEMSSPCENLLLSKDSTIGSGVSQPRLDKAVHMKNCWSTIFHHHHLDCRPRDEPTEMALFIHFV